MQAMMHTISDRLFTTNTEHIYFYEYNLDLILTCSILVIWLIVKYREDKNKKL